MLQIQLITKHKNRHKALTNNHCSVLSFVFVVLVDVVFNGQQVVAHGLEGELMQDR